MTGLGSRKILSLTYVWWEDQNIKTSSKTFYKVKITETAPWSITTYISALIKSRTDLINYAFEIYI